MKPLQLTIGATVTVTDGPGQALGVVMKIDKAGNVSVKIGNRVVNRAAPDVKAVKA